MSSANAPRGPIEPLSRAALFSSATGFDESRCRKALEFALGRIRLNLDAFAPDRYPAPSSLRNVFPIPNDEWTSSFWPGMLWLAYEASGERIYRDAAVAHLPDFRARLDTRRATGTHDLGFLYSLSCVPA